MSCDDEAKRTAGFLEGQTGVARGGVNAGEVCIREFCDAAVLPWRGECVRGHPQREGALTTTGGGSGEGYPDLTWVRQSLRYGHPRVRKRILAAYIVGSAASGEAGPNSDLDIAIVIEPMLRKTALQFTEEYHLKQGLSSWPRPQWGGRPVDFQFFFPDDPELEGYDKVPLQERTSGRSGKKSSPARG